MHALSYMTEKNRKSIILDGLNDQQKAPVVNFTGPSIIDAGPGAGKTKTVVARTAYMIECGVRASNILLFTFTRKAAEEIRDRVISFIGNEGSKVTVGTYHSFCCRILRQHMDLLGRSTNFSIFDTDDQLAIIQRIITKEFRPQEVSGQISLLKDKMLSPMDAAANADGWYTEHIADFYRQYQEALLKENAVDFDDLLYYTIRLFEKNPNIVKKVNDRYRYIVADENQDSAPIDLRLIDFLGGENRNVCLVGDCDQSIYGFRGADIEAVNTYAEAIKPKRYVLGQNYRSTKIIVDAAQTVVKNNTDRVDKHLFTENKEGDKIVHYTLHRAADEAAQLVKVIKFLVREQGRKYSDFAVLYRMSFQSRSVEEAFLKNRIPHKVMSGNSFCSRMEVKDILSYFRFAHNPFDMVSLERAINTPKRGIGKKTIETIVDACLEAQSMEELNIEGVLDVIESNAQGESVKAKGLRQFITVEREILDFEKNHSPGETVHRLVALVSYKKYLKDLNKEEAQDRLENIYELARVADEYPSVDEFLDSMALGESARKQEEENGDDGNKVKLMTLHGSKGLEFPVVFMIGCNQSTIPHWLSIKEGNIDEERRLFYVGMTRAKENLFLSSVKYMNTKNGMMPAVVSQFVKEIDSKYVIER